MRVLIIFIKQWLSYVPSVLAVTTVQSGNATSQVVSHSKGPGSVPGNVTVTFCGGRTNKGTASSANACLPLSVSA